MFVFFGHNLKHFISQYTYSVYKVSKMKCPTVHHSCLYSPRLYSKLAPPTSHCVPVSIICRIVLQHCCQHEHCVTVKPSLIFCVDDASACHATLMSEQLSRGTVEKTGRTDAGCCEGQKQACGDGGCCSTSRWVEHHFILGFTPGHDSKVCVCVCMHML